MWKRSAKPGKGRVILQGGAAFFVLRTCYAAAMWKWTIKFDKAFEIPTYRVKADGVIVGTTRKFGAEWSWEVTFPGQTMPEGCRGTRPTRDECQEAIREKFQALTVGMTRDEARQLIFSAIYRA